MSIEEAALGRSKNPQAEAAASAAIKDATDQMNAAWQAGDKDCLNAAMCCPGQQFDDTALADRAASASGSIQRRSSNK
jgi:hypothetical protein